MKILLSIIFVFVFSFTTFGATYIVTRTDDRNATCNSGVDCSLREAINAANAAGGDDTIEFNLLAQTINLTIGELLITGNITITGPGARLLTVQRSTVPGTGNFRVLNLQDASGIVNISGLSIANGFIESDGGGIRNGYNNTLNLSDVTIRNNRAREGGGIINFGILNITRATIDSNICGQGCGINNNGEFFDGSVTISNSTITNNQAILSFNGTVGRIGGGIQNSAGDIILTNVTISHNTAAESGGGVIGIGRVFIRNTIIADNTAPSVPDATGVNSLGNNLIGINSSSSNQGIINGVNGDKVGTTSAPIDPKLGNLQNNGGQTDTRSLLFGSAALDAGNNCVFLATCPSNNSLLPLLTDQRGNGFTRSADGNGDAIQIVDIGAYEAQIAPLAPTAATVFISGRVMTTNGRGINGVRLSLIDTNGQVRTATTTSFGYYRFDDVQAGSTYILSVNGKHFTFSQPLQVINVNEEASEINFIANSEKRLRTF